MFNKDHYENHLITHPFGEKRLWMKIPGYRFHEGVDISNMKMRKDYLIIRNLFSGIATSWTGKFYGNTVQVKTNPKYFGGLDTVFYTRYCHLKTMSNFYNTLIYPGSLLGQMGDTGLRVIGVHLHLDLYQNNIIENQKTIFLNHLQSLFHFEDRENNFHWQNNKLFINPKWVILYFKLLKEEKKNEK